MDPTLTSRPRVCFEVEKVIGISSDGGFQVQWAPSWVSRYHLVGCEHLIQEFLCQQAERENPLSDTHMSNEVHCPSNDFVVQDCKRNTVHEDAKVNVNDKVDVSANVQLAVNLTQYTDVADTVNQECVVDTAHVEGQVDVTGLVGWNSTKEPDDQEPAVSLTRNTDVTENINPEAEKDRIKKMDKGRGGHPCVVEKGRESSMKVETDASPFHSSESFPNSMDPNCQDVVPEYQESKPGPVIARRQDNVEETYQLENCDNHTDELQSLPCLTQNSEILPLGNVTCESGNARSMDSGNLAESMSRVGIQHHDPHLRMNTFVLNVQKVNVHSTNMLVQDESSGATGYTGKKEKHACTTCGKEFSYKRCLLKHLKLHRQNECEECDASFASKKHLARHLLSKHSSLKPFTCQVRYCKMRFARKDHCQRHISHHLKRIRARLTSHLSNENENNSCSKEKQLSNASMFAKKTKNHTCPICSEQFPLPSLLRQHFRRHSEYRPYVCQYCAASFRDSVSLNTHQHNHSLNNT